MIKYWLLTARKSAFAFSLKPGMPGLSNDLMKHPELENFLFRQAVLPQN
jgi:hypothetical protein